MKRRPSGFQILVILLVGAATALAPAASAQNLLVNPGFESGGGSYTGWFTFPNLNAIKISTAATDNIFRSGVAASKIYGEFLGCPTAGLDVNGYGQAFTGTSMVPGNIYTLSGWSFVTSADSIPGTDTCNHNRCLAKIAFFSQPVGGSEIAGHEVVIGDGNTVKNQWNRFSISIPAPSNARRVEALILFLQPACEGGSTFIDDLSLTSAAPPAPESNVLANPRFNNGPIASLTGWTVFDNVFSDNQFWAVRTPPGVAKLYTSGSDTNPSGMYQTFGAAASSAWKLELQAMSSCRDPILGTDNFATAKITFFDAGLNELGNSETVIADGASPPGTWTNHVLIGLAPVGTAFVRPYILFHSPLIEAGSVFVDDVTFRQLSATGLPNEPARPVFELRQNAPNPFSASTRITFELAEAADVRVSVFDIAGRQVAGLVNGRMDPGVHGVTWGGTASDGSRAAAGMYRVVLETPKGRASRSMLLLK